MPRPYRGLPVRVPSAAALWPSAGSGGEWQDRIQKRSSGPRSVSISRRCLATPRPPRARTSSSADTGWPTKSERRHMCPSTFFSGGMRVIIRSTGRSHHRDTLREAHHTTWCHRRQGQSGRVLRCICGAALAISLRRRWCSRTTCSDPATPPCTAYGQPSCRSARRGWGRPLHRQSFLTCGLPLWRP